MLQETLALLSTVPVLGLLWVSAGTRPPMGTPQSPSRITDPISREDDDDFDEDEEEELEEEELEDEELDEEEEEEDEDEM